MKEVTKKLIDIWEKDGFKFVLTEGEGEGKPDIIDFSVMGELTNYDVRIVVNDVSVFMLSYPINRVKEQKFGVLLETLNYLNHEHGFVKFYAAKNEDEESYYIVMQTYIPYGNHKDMEEILDLLSYFFDIIDEVYPQIVKCIV